MTSLPRPAPSLTTLLRARLVRTSRGLAQHALTGCHVLRSLHARLTSPGHSRRPNADSRNHQPWGTSAPTMPTWLRLAPVGVAGLEPAASHSQSGRSTKLSYTPFLLLFLYCISCRCACQKMLPCGSSPTLTSTANVGSPMLGVHFSRRKLRPFPLASLADMNNHSAQTNAMSTRKQVNHATMWTVCETTSHTARRGAPPQRGNAHAGSRPRLIEDAISRRTPTRRYSLVYSRLHGLVTKASSKSHSAFLRLLGSRFTEVSVARH